MAEEIVLNIDTNATETVAEVKNLKQQFAEAEDALFSLAGAGKQGTEEFKKAQKEAAGLKQEVDRINQSLDLLKPEARVQAIGTVINGVAGAFSAATGAAALFGNESKEVEEALLKVQAALAIQQGVQSIVELGKQFRVLQAILLANPIFLIATAIAGIITAVVGLDNVLGGLKAGFSAVGDAIGYAFDGLKQFVATIFDTGAAIVNFVENSKALRIALGILTFGATEWGFALKNVVKSYLEASAVSKEINSAIAKAQNEKIKLIREEIKLIEEAEKKNKEKFDAEIGNIDFEIKKRQAAGLDYAEQEKKKLELTIARIRQELEAETKKAILLEELAKKELERLEGEGDFAFVKSKRRAEESAKLRDDLTQRLKEAEQSLTLFEISEQKKRSDAYKTANEKRLADEKKLADDLKALQEQQLKDLGEVQKKSSDGILENINAVQKSFADILAESQQQLLDATSEYTNKDVELFKQGQEAKVQLLSDGLNTLASLTELFGANNEKNAKRAFEINKALNLASAIVQTYQSAQGAYLSQLSIPTPDAPIRAAIAAGIAITSGLANVAKIAQTKFETKTASGGAPSVSGLPSVGGAPQTGGTPNIGTTQLDRNAIEQGNNNQNNQMRVYVVESDISESQSRVNGIVNRATIR